MSSSSPRLESSSQRVGKNVTFGRNVTIVAESIEIEDYVVLQDNISIACRGSLRIGHHGILGSGARVQCNDLTIGNWLYACDGLEIGSGGCNSRESNITIGSRVGIFEKVLINPNSEVTIGSDCGIGREVQIWTHGAWLDPLAGFPSDFGPVTIGDRVWLPSRCVVLPNTSIGNDCVIGINSIINKPIPSGSFAAGCPAKVLKENAYPRNTPAVEAERMVRRILADWDIQIKFKLPDLNYSVEVLDLAKFRLRVDDAETIFDWSAKTVEGATTPISEDLRDYLRRRGIKIYTDDFFRSV